LTTSEGIEGGEGTGERAQMSNRKEHIEFRDLKTLQDLAAVVDLQYAVWAFSNAGDAVPLQLLAVHAKRGGVLVGAWDEGKLVGFAYSMPALKGSDVSQWSHMLAVLPDYRACGLGYALKVEQRRRIAATGTELIEWTFDPLQAVNAYLNLSKLGAVSREYAENIYGPNSSSLNHGTPTDRLIVQWWIRSDRVARALAGHGRVELPADSRPANTTHRRDEVLWCEAAAGSLSSPRIHITIPMGFTEMLKVHPAAARDWREQVRRLFQSCLHAGFEADGFVLNPAESVGHYLLTRPS